MFIVQRLHASIAKMTGMANPLRNAAVRIAVSTQFLHSHARAAQASAGSRIDLSAVDRPASYFLFRPDDSLERC
jgi:hypothetical protein